MTNPLCLHSGINNLWLRLRNLGCLALGWQRMERVRRELRICPAESHQLSRTADRRWSICACRQPGEPFYHRLRTRPFDADRHHADLTELISDWAIGPDHRRSQRYHCANQRPRHGHRHTGRLLHRPDAHANQRNHVASTMQYPMEYGVQQNPDRRLCRRNGWQPCLAIWFVCAVHASSLRRAGLLPDAAVQ